jgi:peptide/nickel transport system ATP-binding protein
VRQVTERVVVLYRGEVVEQGATDGVLDRPQHAYTQRLVASMPRVDGDWLA